MLSVPEDLHSRLKRHGQEHTLIGWELLTTGERHALVEQLTALDLAGLAQLFAQRDNGFKVPTSDEIAPAPVIPLEGEHRAARALGEQCLARGEVAVLLVAGGQGSRLGFEHPKGMFPIGPVSDRSLFQIHAEKVLALRRQYGKPVPFLILTSPATDVETRAFFAELGNFGLPADEVFFFRQGTMPALALQTGRLLMEAPGQLFTSPNGHGGTLTALADSGLLRMLRDRGIRHIFYFQVDNPLVNVADPAFLGYHVAEDAEVSSKIVAKESAKDKLGNLVLVNGRCCMIEYSDLPEELGWQTDEHGKLRLWAGSPAIHIFDVAFLERVTGTPARLPYHVARKKVPCLDERGNPIQPRRENALKFEMFIFDVLPLAERWTVMEANRSEEFVPLKNAEGPDSPEVVRQALSNVGAAWLEKAGVSVPRKPNGDAAVSIEISPLLAADSQKLAAAASLVRFDGPVCLNGKET